MLHQQNKTFNCSYIFHLWSYYFLSTLYKWNCCGTLHREEDNLHMHLLLVVLDKHIHMFYWSRPLWEGILKDILTFIHCKVYCLGRHTFPSLIATLLCRMYNFLGYYRLDKEVDRPNINYSSGKTHRYKTSSFKHDKCNYSIEVNTFGRFCLASNIFNCRHHINRIDRNKNNSVYKMVDILSIMDLSS